MSNLEERLREVMAAKSWRNVDLMRVSGQSSSVVAQWLGGGSKEIKTIGKLEAAQAIGAASGFAPLWIAKGIGPKFTEQAVLMDAKPSFANIVDLLGDLLDGMDDATRMGVAQQLQLLAQAPDSRRTRAALAEALIKQPTLPSRKQA